MQLVLLPGQTVVLAKTAEDRRFGGFADVPWASPQEDDEFIESHRAFLFRLTHGIEEGGREAAGVREGEADEALFHSAGWGPFFGGDFILGDSNGHWSCRNLYKPFADGLSVAGDAADDLNYFTAVEWEVYVPQ